MNNDIEIFNRRLVRKRRNRASGAIKEHDFIINLAADYMIERLVENANKYRLALDLGCHSGQMGAKTFEAGLAENVIYCDSSSEMAAQVQGLKLVADEEFLPFANSSFDLILSSMSLHWVNDLPGALLQIRQCLKAGGMFIAAMPGIQTLQELRHCLMEAEIEVTGGTAPHISPFSDVKTMGHLLGRAGFANPVADSETVQVSYSNMLELMRDIKNMGQGNALLKRGSFIRCDVLALAGQKYQQLYGDGEGGIVATIDIITITGLAG